MITIAVRNPGGFARRVRALPTALERLVKVTMTDAVSYGQRTGFGQTTTPTRLAVRTGTLRAAFGAQVRRSGANTVTARLGFLQQARIARVHEFGATIRPRTAQFLAIPLPAARGRRPREFTHTFIRKGIIFQRVGSRVIPLFVLKRSVTIPARPVLRPTWLRYRGILLARLRRAL
jgi:hypothetical protein